MNPKSNTGNDTMAPGTGKWDVMISYEWRSGKVFAERLCPVLEEAGLSVWWDNDQMHDDMLECMARGISNSDVILLFISDQYEKSKNCSREYQHAHTTNSKIIPIIVEKYYPPADSSLAMLISGKIYYKLYEEFDENARKIIEAVKKLQEGKENAPMEGNKKANKIQTIGEDVQLNPAVVASKNDEGKENAPMEGNKKANKIQTIGEDVQLNPAVVASKNDEGKENAPMEGNKKANKIQTIGEDVQLNPAVVASKNDEGKENAPMEGNKKANKIQTIGEDVQLNPAVVASKNDEGKENAPMEGNKKANKIQTIGEDVQLNPAVVASKNDGSDGPATTTINIYGGNVILGDSNRMIIASQSGADQSEPYDERPIAEPYRVNRRKDAPEKIEPDFTQGSYADRFQKLSISKEADLTTHPLEEEEALQQGLARSIGDWNEEFHEEIAGRLAHGSTVVSSWLEVARRMDIDQTVIDKMKDKGVAHRLLFYRIRDDKPQLKIDDIKNILEKKMKRSPRNDIFYDYKRIPGLPGLEEEIGSLNGARFELILEHIADKLIADRIRSNWRHFGGYLDYPPNILNEIEARGKQDNATSSARMFLNYLGSIKKDVKQLVECLGKVQRNDVREIIEQSLKKDDCWIQSCAIIEAYKNLAASQT